MPQDPGHRGSALVTVEIVDSLARVAPAEWNRLARDDPFVSHEYLSALHETGCARRNRLDAALPPARRRRRAHRRAARSTSRTTPTASTCSTGPGPTPTSATASTTTRSCCRPCRSRRCPGRACSRSSRRARAPDRCVALELARSAQGVLAAPPVPRRRDRSRAPQAAA